MMRKTLTILSLIGLLLSVGLWGVSHWQSSWVFANDHVNLALFRGCICVGVSDFGYSRTGFQVKPFKLRTYWSPRFYSYLLTMGGPKYGTCRIPLWIPAFMCGSSFLIVTRPLYRLRKRKKLGLCLKCGYDLRASKDRCPECGSPFENRRSDNNCHCGAGSTK